jgi:Ca-activated chloride channel homolog
MNLLWPASLGLLVLLPLLVGLYIWQIRRRKRYAVRYASLSLVREALAGQSQWRRHVPFALFLLALAVLIGGLSRPVSVLEVPVNQTSIILAMDVSRSMCTTDIPPNRLVAAQEAALRFIRDQPAGTRIGIVAFAGFAQLIQPPTTDRATLEQAVESLVTNRGTAIGSGILESIDAIAEENPAVEPSVQDEFANEPPGEPANNYVPEIIVVLTDGVTTTGMPPLEAAKQAAERGIRIYTIGFGTENNDAPMTCGGFTWNFGGNNGGGGGGGNRFRLQIDEETLIRIADLTGGEYYLATSAGELQQVFSDLPIAFATESEVTEISVVFAGIGALLAALAIGISLARHRWF